MTHPPATLDHLVYATPWLERSLEELEAMLGVTPLPGGTHPAWATRNAILPLSPTTYLEVIGPDAQQSGTRPGVFEIASLRTPRLVTWAAKATQLANLVARAATYGLRLGLPVPGSRQRPDGTVLSWELTDPVQVREGGLVPFFIDWGASPHPADAGPALLGLSDLRAEHPDAARIQMLLNRLGIDLTVTPGSRPRLRATLKTPRGIVTLE